MLSRGQGGRRNTRPRTRRGHRPQDRGGSGGHPRQARAVARMTASVADKEASKVRRELLALLGRLADGPLTLEAGLRATAAVRRGLDALQTELVDTARSEGASWAAIGEAL